MKLVKILSAPAVIAAAGMVMAGCEIPAGNEAASLPGAVGTAGGKPGQSLAAVLDETSKTVSYYWHTEGWNHESVRDTGLDLTQVDNPAEFDNGAFRIKKRDGTIPVKFYEVTGIGAAPIVVEAGDTVDMVLNDETIDMTGMPAASPIELEDDATLILRLRGENTLIASGGAAGIHVTTNRTLTITSADGDWQTSGTLTASISGLDTSGYAGAGIGGNQGEDGGTITIAGGTIITTGGSGGAGIGGGYSGSGGTITIDGGTGTATGGGASYGIGPGEGGTGGTLNGSAIKWPAVNSFTWPGINLGVPVAIDPGVTYSDGVFTIADGTTVTVRGSTTSNRLVVNSGKYTILTFDSANIDLSGTADSVSPLDLADGADVTLLLKGTSTLTASGGAAGVHITTGRTLTITSADGGDGAESGTLIVSGGGTNGSGAGIGGGMSDGTDAGIPKGEAGGTITIAGGTVTAAGGASGGTWGGAAGIGGSGDVDSANGLGFAGAITISGGVVNAEGGSSGAGIGGGAYAANDTGSVTITGGNVTAKGGTRYAAGIGGGSYGNGGSITISGGTVTATSGSNAAGIGGGSKGAGGTVIINNPGTSTGTATGNRAAGVGPGREGSGGTFNGGAFPTANPYTWL